MNLQTIKMIERTPEVIEVKLNRPELHNAFNELMIEELTRLFQQMERRSDLRLIILSAEGPSFSAGADLNWMGKLAQKSQQENYQDALNLGKLFQVLDDCPHPMIGVVQGQAYGGGVGLMAVCDEVIMVRSAMWGLTEVRLGLVPAVISPFVAAKIGPSQARRLFISGARVNADEALRVGLTHHLVDEQQIEEKLQSLIKIYLEAGPLAQRQAKQLAKRYRHQVPAPELAKLISEIRVGEEAQEGMRSLLEKRKPQWPKVLPTTSGKK